MIQLSDSARTLIVARYAQTGRWPETARLIYFGSKTKGRIKGNWIENATRVEAPGAYPADLVAECNRARTSR